MLKMLKTTVLMTIVMTALTGLAYPAFVTLLARAAFSHQANGSLIREGDTVVGSELIGQPIDDPRYFWSRPSATVPAYNAASSSGSNLGPTNPALRDAVRARAAALRASDPGNTAKIPIDLVTASASGLDPHISTAAALYQLPRVARARGVSEDKVRALIAQYAEPRWLGAFGEPCVNVLLLDRALDHIVPASRGSVLADHGG